MALLTGIIVGLILIIGIMVGFTSNRIKEAEQQTYRANFALAELEKLRQEYDSFQSTRKSSETRLGLISEQLAPMLDAFPVKDTQDIHFFGQPIDYIAFNEDGVHFVEIKSGNARLSPKQAKIKEQVLAGKVFWHVMRIK